MVAAQAALDVAERELELARNPKPKKKGWRDSACLRCLFPHSMPADAGDSDAGDSPTAPTAEKADDADDANSDLRLAMLARQQMRTEKAEEEEVVSNPVAQPQLRPNTERDDESDGDVEEV